VAPRVSDDSGALQLQRRLGHPFASDAEHGGDQLLRHHQFVALCTVEAQQEPSTQLLVQRVAHGRLRHLCHQPESVTSSGVIAAKSLM
jgi:hypothetical protein